MVSLHAHMLLAGCAAKGFWRRVQSIIAHKQLILAEIGLLSTGLMTPDVDAAYTFYQVVFGWEYNIGGLEFGGYTTARS